MKKAILGIVLIFSLSTVMIGCRGTKTNDSEDTTEEIKDGLNEAEEEVKDAANDVKEEVDGETDDL
jgi:hypothetical protein